MRLAVTGTTGRVGAALAQCFSHSHEVVSLPRSTCDFSDPDSLSRALAGLECDVILNPAAVTSLEVCEDDPVLAHRVNAEAPAEIAAWAAARGIPVFHFSTDYVFAGNVARRLAEAATASPVNVYGKSKLAGESAVLAGPANCVIRVSWVFGPEKPSFIDHIAIAALAGKPLAAVCDKLSLPAFTADLAQWTERLIESKTCGIVHACQSGEPVSWHGMATAVTYALMECEAISELPQIERLPLDSMAAFRAKRPRFTAMDNSRLSEILGHPPRHWREALAEHVRRQYSTS